MKTIVSDEAPNINADDNELLRIENDKKKEALTEAKARLAEKYSDIRTLAPLVEQGTQLHRQPSPSNPLAASAPSHPPSMPRQTTTKPARSRRRQRR